MSMSTFLCRNLPKFVVGAAALLAASVSANAVTYDLTSDFSNTANPNGAWSYIYGGSPLAHQTSASGGGSFPAAIPSDGYFATSTDLNTNSPIVVKAAVNGSAAGENDSAFLSGDVLVHSPNSGTSLSVVWTAPTSGTITDLVAEVWYAHPSVLSQHRSNEVTLDLGISELVVWTVAYDDGTDRSSPHSYQPGGSFSVNVGDTLVLNFVRTSAGAGSINGVRESFTFNSAVPLPAALPLFASGLGVMGVLGWRRKRKKAMATVPA
jgi:PEP-CTERM motif